MWLNISKCSKTTAVCEFLGFRSGAVEASLLHWCGTASPCDWYPTFRNSVVVLPSGVEYPKKNGEKLLRRFNIKTLLSRNVGHRSPSNAEPHPRRKEPQIQPWLIHVEFNMNQIKLFRNERGSSIMFNLIRWQRWPRIKISSFQCSFDNKVKKLTMRSTTRIRLSKGTIKYWQFLGLISCPTRNFSTRAQRQKLINICR
jgi:hypothetical protein